MAENFADKVCMITGGGSGIGRAAALAFSRRGAAVVVADIDAQGGEETVALLKKSGGKASFFYADVSAADQVVALINHVVSTYGRLDCAFNNAGIGGDRALTADCTEENWDRVLRVNLKSVWLCMKYEILQMLQQGGGVIVNTASVAGLQSAKTAPAYVASKHGIVGLTKTAAREYAANKIRVNAVCPGYIQTPMMDLFTLGNKEYEAAVAARSPMGRMGEAEEVAEAVVWLCSDAASYVNSHALVVDGGLIL